MKTFAISDLHLSLSTPDKSMEKFGQNWINYEMTIARNWIDLVSDDDLVLIAGDISWATKLSNIQEDMNFISQLPGKKIITRGNHDYWWSTLNKLRTHLPDNIIPINKNAISSPGLIICGTRLWDIPGVTFEDIIEGDSRSSDNLASDFNTDTYQQNKI